MADNDSSNPATAGDQTITGISGDHQSTSDILDLSEFHTNLHELRADHADAGTLNLSVEDYPDKAALRGSIILTGDAGDDLTQDHENMACFAGGSRILTTRGEVPVEELTAGDMVHTMDNGVQPVLGLLSRRVPARAEFAPVVISKGALGNARALRVSPLHRMLITGWQSEVMFGEGEVLVAAKHLVNGSTIFQMPAAQVTYFQIVFARHEIIYAEGIASESFLVSAQSLALQDRETYAALVAIFPALATAPEKFGKSARPTLKPHEVELLVSLAS
ncbi:intein N-terminal splicing region [Yoonia tamlensis]|uniref:Intein N-terminal splicing region n=1 Tax=Yoonia tamlensis TaxID=390270 RepID=A0A1I6FPS0_9RHOB|nr:Hint domain-containing protein [Yoonia tamlensis]SFR31939.1 intein N-terminal splicing region [Yoonia tamlensis]